jgi:hypothetical protein
MGMPGRKLYDAGRTVDILQAMLRNVQPHAS